MSTQVTISARVPEELSQQLDQLATATRRNRSWLVAEALRRYVEEQAWQVQAIQEALTEYRAGESVLVPDEEVAASMEAIEDSINGTLDQ